jgi:two-component system sensor histidine kinase DesK
VVVGGGAEVGGGAVLGGGVVEGGGVDGGGVVPGGVTAGGVLPGALVVVPGAGTVLVPPPVPPSGTPGRGIVAGPSCV